jgi:hypothetical protein
VPVPVMKVAASEADPRERALSSIDSVVARGLCGCVSR